MKFHSLNKSSNYSLLYSVFLSIPSPNFLTPFPHPLSQIIVHKLLLRISSHISYLFIFTNLFFSLTRITLRVLNISTIHHSTFFTLLPFLSLCTSFTISLSRFPLSLLILLSYFFHFALLNLPFYGNHTKIP